MTSSKRFQDPWNNQEFLQQFGKKFEVEAKDSNVSVKIWTW